MQALTTTLLRHYRTSRVLAAGALALLALAPAAVPAQTVVSDYDRPITSLSPQRHRAAVTELVNHERAEHGLALLVQSRELVSSARAWAIVTRRSCGVLSHGDFPKRAQRFGFVRAATAGSHRYVGENIGFGSGGFSTPREIVRDWMNSPGHRANILRNWTSAAVWSSRSGDAVAVVQHFGRSVGE